MQKNNSRLICKRLKVLSLLFLLYMPFVSHASTATTTLAVNATVLSACTVAAAPMTFGTYNPVGGSGVSSTAVITTTCTNTTPYTIGLNAGNGTGASVTNRKMTGQTNSSNLLDYGLYQDSNHSTNWGNTPGTDTPSSVTGNGTPQLVTVYGLIAANTNAEIDTYLDTVTITVNY